MDFTTARIAAILNTASGSCDASSEQKMRDILEAAGATDVKMWATGAEGIENAFKEALEYEPEVLIVLGGDGTIRAGAESCTSTGPLLIPLPGGTMNMLPKALYGNVTWDVALAETLKAPKILPVSGGTIGSHQFFIAAIIGAPTLWAQAREALREGDLGGVVEKGVHAFQNMLSIDLTYSFSEDESAQASTLTVMCPLISEVMDAEEPYLEAAVIDVKDAGSVLELASAAATGKWRESNNVTTVKTRKVSVSAEQDIPVILDGESMDFGKEFEIAFVPQAFKAVVF